MVNCLDNTEDLEQRVIQFICENKCGTDFDHPDSCEKCIGDIQMQDYFKWELKQAKKQGEDYFNN